MEYLDRFSNSCASSSIWAIVDSTVELRHVDSAYIFAEIFVVYTPSPPADRIAWASKVDCRWFILDPWSLQELICGRQLQYSSVPSERSLAESVKNMAQWHAMPTDTHTPKKLNFSVALD